MTCCKIIKIEVETIEKKNGEKEYLVWAVDDIGRDWRIESSGHYGEGTALRLGKTESFHTCSNKENGVKNIKHYIDIFNRESDRHNQLEVVSTSLETILL